MLYLHASPRTSFQIKQSCDLFTKTAIRSPQISPHMYWNYWHRSPSMANQCCGSKVSWLGKYYRNWDPKEPFLLTICFFILDSSHLPKTTRIVSASLLSPSLCLGFESLCVPRQNSFVNKTIAIISGSVLKSIKYKGSHSLIQKKNHLILYAHNNRRWFWFAWMRCLS